VGSGYLVDEKLKSPIAGRTYYLSEIAKFFRLAVLVNFRLKISAPHTETRCAFRVTVFFASLD